LSIDLPSIDQSGGNVTQYPSIKDRIVADIASGALPFGARLTIDELAVRYDSSHMPVREALRALQGAGVLETGPGRSAMVREFDPTLVDNLFSTRIAIETMLLRRAAQLCTSTHVRVIQEIEDELEARLAEENYTEVLRQNRRFHGAINDVAGNPEAVAIIDRHWLLITALWQRVSYAPERFPAVVNDHRYLLRALALGDSEAAATLMGAHMIKAKFELLERMKALKVGEVKIL
jgi:DNA-binding GntR family transcriptional regulator